MMYATIRSLLGLVKFSHTLFALPFALLGAALAAHRTGRLARAPARLAGHLALHGDGALGGDGVQPPGRPPDRCAQPAHRDAAPARPARSRSPSVAAFTALTRSAFVASTLLFLPNRWPLLLSVPVLLWLLGYSYAKRFTSLAHVWLGALARLAPLAAWIALRGDLAWPPVCLGLAVLFWVTGFDIIYACQDVELRPARTASTASPRRLGVRNALRLAAACHAADDRRALRAGLWSIPLGSIYFLGVARRRRACWSTSTPWSGPTTWLASTSRSSRSTSPSASACSSSASPTCSSRCRSSRRLIDSFNSD